MNNIELVEVETHSDYAQKMAKTYLPPKKLFDKRVSLSAKYKRKYEIFAGFKAFDSDMSCLDFKYEEGVLYIYILNLAKYNSVREDFTFVLSHWMCSATIL